MNSVTIYIVYALPLLIIYALFVRRRTKLEQVSQHTHRESVESGMTQPPSLHPVIDLAKCIGCEACVHACPEFPLHQVLGIVGNKAKLVSPTDCIGHGACKRVCPVGAISLVFGTEERGVDIPEVSSDFSTNIPGIFIAGELGGMGLIRNAIEQGRQAMESIANLVRSKRARANVAEVVDVIIVGAGPAGIAATLGAMEKGLSHVTIEQNSLGGTVAGFPRGKMVMTSPAELPKVGKVQFTETTKEELIGFWQKVQRDTGMKIQTEERLLGVDCAEFQQNGCITAKTDKKHYRARSLLLAIGRRGTPRRLGVPGEEMPKVVYSLIDPAQYDGQHVLVVGGGDSALEAACSLSDEAGTQVTLSYRSETFSRAKKKNRDRVSKAQANGQLQVLMSSNVTLIDTKEVLLEQGGKVVSIANDIVIVCAGGILPTWLLEEIGISVEKKFGTL